MTQTLEVDSSRSTYEGSFYDEGNNSSSICTNDYSTPAPACPHHNPALSRDSTQTTDVRNAQLIQWMCPGTTTLLVKRGEGLEPSDIQVDRWYSKRYYKCYMAMVC
jgi:hypothetical protein